jgi:hypothetical protein
MPQQSATITVRIANERPVELLDFTNSLMALGAQFQRDVAARADGFEGKLYVKELRQGSLVADLVVLAPFALGAMAATNAGFDFVANLRGLFAWLSAQGPKPDEVDPKAVAAASAIVEPVAKDNGSKITINVQGDVNAPITVNALQANAVQNGAKRYLDSIKAPECERYEKVILYWATVQNQNGVTVAAGEKARVDKISDRAVKVVFDSRELRDEMIHSATNPLHEAFVVDLEVQTVRDKIATYKVLQMHERFRLDDDPQQPLPDPK